MVRQVHFMTSFLRICAVPALLSIAVAATPALSAGQGRCLVDDPTGTPLNVRSAPNGTILTTLANGARIDVIEETKLGTKRWLFVSRDGERLGWIFGAYVVCPHGGDVPEAAPSQPAEQR
jgi:hypothetical protein